MDILEIQGLWQKQNTELEASLILNLALLKEVKLDKAKSSLRGLYYLPISSMLFYCYSFFYCLYFIISNWTTWYFIVSGIGISILCMLYIIVSIRQLKQLLTIDYQAPILELQLKLSKLKSSVVDNLRIANWVLPCFPIMAIFFSKVFWGKDFVANLSTQMFYYYIALFIFLIIVSIFVSHQLSPKNLNKKWLNLLLLGSGSQVEEALNFLIEIEELKYEKLETNNTST